MDQFVQVPEVILSSGKWPHIPDIINTTDHNIQNHCWFQLGKAVKLPRNNAVTGPSRTMEKEVKSDGSEAREPRQTSISAVVPEDVKGESSRVVNNDDEVRRGHSCSRGCKPRKWAQSIATINSDDDSVQVSSQLQPK